MKNLIEDFNNQLKEARQIGSAASITQHNQPIKNITLLGLGGSAFGGEIIKNHIYDFAKIPFNIVRDYKVPAYIGEDSLVIVSSYSGNTEETLSAFNQALPRNPKVVCITSGGKVLDMANEHGFDHIKLPGGFPPRAAAGFSIVQVLFTLNKLDLIPDFQSALEESINLIENFSDHDNAKLIAEKFHQRVPAIYTSSEFEAAGIRWRQQIEENGKHIAFHHVVPEMNHNELVGWKNPADILKRSVAIFLESDLDQSRVAVRMKINKDIIGKYAGEVITLHPKGSTKLAQLFYLLHFGDWVSFYLAEYNEEDPMPVDVIDFLKSELAKIPN